MSGYGYVSYSQWCPDINEGPTIEHENNYYAPSVYNKMIQGSCDEDDGGEEEEEGEEEEAWCAKKYVRKVLATRRPPVIIALLDYHKQ